MAKQTKQKKPSPAIKVKRVRPISAPLAPTNRVDRAICLLRGEKVLLDTDLAVMYGVPTKVLNQAVQRNRSRFPADFMFQLTQGEADHLRLHGRIEIDSQSGEPRSDIPAPPRGTAQFGPEIRPNLKSQSVTSSWGGSRKRPYAFTEQGIAMLSSVLRSPRAVAVNIEIMRAFVRLRRLLMSHADLAKRLVELERKYDAKFRTVFDALRAMMKQEAEERPYQSSRIGFKPPSDDHETPKSPNVARRSRQSR